MMRMLNSQRARTPYLFKTKKRNNNENLRVE